MPTYTPEMDAELAEASKALIAAKAPVVPTDKAAPAAPVIPDKVEGAPASGAVPSAPTADDKAKAPEAKPVLVPDFLPEKIRPKVHVDDEEALETLKAGYLAHSEATKRFTAAKALERDAANYRAFKDDPVLGPLIVQAALDKQAGKTPRLAPYDGQDPSVPPEERFDDATEARLARERERVKAETLAQLRAEAARPQQAIASVNEAITQFAIENEVDKDLMLAAVELAKPALLRTMDPEQVPALMPAYLELAKVKAAAPKAPPPQPTSTPPAAPRQADATSNGNLGLETVASPIGRSSPNASQVVEFPKFYVNGQPPRRPLTEDEMEEVGLFAMRRRFGPDVTLEEYRIARR